MNRSKSSLEASARSTDRDVISSLRAFDSKPTKRNCAELNEIFDISSGNVKKRYIQFFAGMLKVVLKFIC